MNHQSQLTTNRSSSEVKMNGRRKTRLKNSYFYNNEWYFESGKKYNDHGDVPNESEKTIR